MKGKTSPWLYIVLIGLAYVAWSSGALNGIGFSTTNSGLTPQTPATTGNFVCQPNNGYNVLGVAVRDGIVTTGTLYTPVSVAAVGSDGNIISSATSSGAATLTFTSINVPCSSTKLVGTAYILAGSGATVNSASAPYDLAQKLQDQIILLSSNTTNLQFALRDVSSNSNTSVLDADGYSEITANETAPTTVGAGSTRSVNVDLVGITGNRQFGSQSGLIWAIDTVDASAFSDKAVSLSSSTIQLQEITCPQRETSFDSANRCYRSGPIKTSDGTLRISITQNADLGNPGATADPVIYINDVQSFEEDGRVVTDTFNKAGTNVGTASNAIHLDNA